MKVTLTKALNLMLTTVQPQQDKASAVAAKDTRICLFPETLAGGGIGRTNLNLARGLLELGADVDFFLTSKKGALTEQIPLRARVFEGGGSVKTSLRPLYQYLNQEKPHALITAHVHVNIASTLVHKFTRGNTLLINTIHTATSTDDTTLKKRMLSKVSKFSYPHADKVVAVSRAAADDTADYLGLPKRRFDVIYNPVITPELFEKAEQSITHPFFNEAQPVIVSVGRLTKQKDYSTLLRAFALLQREVKSKLIILGEGEDRAKLEDLVSELELTEDVSLHGFDTNPYAYMADAKLFVSSSAWEGLPTVIIEALALGTPVVATDCPGGTREILEGGFGELVPVANPEALAIAMKESLRATPDKDKLRQRGASFSYLEAARNYLELTGRLEKRGGL